MEEAATKAPETKRPESNLPPASARPAAQAPVMDVHRPTASQPSQPSQPSHPADSSHQVHEAPKDEDTGNEKLATQPAVVQTKVKKPAKPQQSGTGGAIVATVVIVLGLAVLAVYAYLKSN